MNECMLTTIDNPFDPFEDFTKWYLYDIERGYNTCALIGRVGLLLGLTDEGLSYDEQNKQNEYVFDNIIDNIGKPYKKVYQENDYYKESLPGEG